MLAVKSMSGKSDSQKASIQEKRNVIMRQIRRWRQAQFVYMPGAIVPSLSSHENGADDNDAGDLEPAEQIPLFLPSAVPSARRNTVCLHHVAEYEHQLRLAQLRDSLIELRRVRRIRHSLLTNHQTQIAGQGQRSGTRSRTLIDSTEDRISKFAQRYRIAYSALLQLDPTGEWQETYLELKEEDNRGPGKEQHEQSLGDGSYTFSWIWLLNPRACDTGESEGELGASDEEVNDAMRVQWVTSSARMERWVEEVELLQEEMRRVVTYLEWKSGQWMGKQDARSTTAALSIQSGLQAYAHKQARIYHDLAVAFSKLWRPTLVSYGLKHTWVTLYMKKHGVLLEDTNTPIGRAKGILKTRLLNVSDEDCPTIPKVPSLNSSDVNMVEDHLLLEEAHYAEHYQGDSSDSTSLSGSDNDSDDDGDYDDDFEFNFYFD